MIRLALECPVPFMSELLPLTDFDFALAHLAHHSATYRQMYIEQKQSGRQLILDNSTNELGEPYSLDQMDRIAEILSPDLIIPPDWLGEGKKTLEALKEAEQLWGLPKILPVVQGADWSDLENSLYTLSSRGYTTVAVPYDILCDRKEPLKILALMRQRVVNHIIVEFPRLGIHLLGLNTLQEVGRYKHHSQILSIDTGAPFLNATFGGKFGISTLIPKGTYIDYEKEYVWGFNGVRDLAKENIQFLKGLLNGNINVRD